MSTTFRKLTPFTDQFATVRKAWLHNSTLSFTARGILGAIVAFDPGAVVTPETIMAMSPDSSDVIESALCELTEAGYLVFDEISGDTYLDDPDPIVRPEPVAGRVSASSQSVVYYLQAASGDIKIGFSASLPRRLDKLREEHGPLTLLATEPGGWHREQGRHEQFAEYRIRPDREWFRPSPDLLQHIAELPLSAVTA